MSDNRDSRHSQAARAAALVQAYRNGDTNALGELVEMYRNPLYSFILRMVDTQSEADDIFQDVWFRAIRSMNSYKHKSFMSWLFRIAHNVVVDHARHRKVEARMDPPPEREQEAASWAESFADAHPLPDQLVIARETSRRVEAAVAALPPEQREVFSLRMLADLPFREIARIQGVSINTALARMQYALDKVRKALADLREVSL